MNLFINKDYINSDIKLIEKYLQKGDVFVDVGANIGAWTLFASNKVGNDGKVFSFEPHPITYKYLVENVILNEAHNIITENCGIANKVGYLYFTNSLDDTNHIALNNENDTIKIPVKKLDDFTENEKKIHLLKIDVEGFELFALQGAIETLRKTEILIFESWAETQRQYNYSFSELFSFIINFGFEIYKIEDGDSYTLIENSDYSSQTCENLVAIKDKKISEI